MGTLAEAAAGLKQAAGSTVAGAHPDDRRGAARRSAPGRPRAAGGERNHPAPLRRAGARGARPPIGRHRAPARAGPAGGGGPRARAARSARPASICRSAPFAARARCAGSGSGWSQPPSILPRRYARLRLAARTRCCSPRSSPPRATRMHASSASTASRRWRRRARSRSMPWAALTAPARACCGAAGLSELPASAGLSRGRRTRRVRAAKGPVARLRGE